MDVQMFKYLDDEVSELERNLENIIDVIRADISKSN